MVALILKVNKSGSRSDIFVVSIQPLASIAIIVSWPVPVIGLKFVFSPQIELKGTWLGEVFDCVIAVEVTK